MSNNEDCCFAKILKVIDVLQRNAEKIDDIDNTCTRPFLGGCPNLSVFNTRPVTFYTGQNTLYTINYQSEENGVPTVASSSVFRVENVEGCCCTCQILAPNPDTTDPNRPYIATGQFATINLRCVCVIQCLPDVVVDCL